MYEKRLEALAPAPVFARRIARHAAVAGALVGCSLALGMAGYHGFEGLPWIDAFLNSAMLLGGMGPVDALHTGAGKLFAGCFALYCGLVVIVAAGLLFAPFVHRLLHRFHLDAGSGR
ncbi:MAG TPA: hypothetical protein VMU00_01970 [Steroidobacteraceae bacterium]|nr:hypothetical protein [Steroidobacteraceae bacterium]